MIINHNITALNTHRQLSTASSAQANSMEKLSSGLRINSAKDDAAGLSISEKMRGQIRGLEQAGKNAQDGISLLQTAEGALNETHSILQRMNELATQAANGTLSENDRTAVKDEVTALNTEIDRIASATKFNGQTLIDGKFGTQLDAASTMAVGTAGVTSIDISGAESGTTYTLAKTTDGMELSDGKGNAQTVTNTEGDAGVLDFSQLGVKIGVSANWTEAATVGTVVTNTNDKVTLQIGSENSTDQQLGLSINKMNSDADSLNTKSIDVTTATGAQAAITVIQKAIDNVSLERSKMGAASNRLEHTINNLSSTSENLTAAESRIRDVDYAEAA
ncbi:flagellin [Planococcus sp. YIM B11945]|uniref:flagellin N-terminal helical domain-containing protein n=1 Tax=Planococcus sp. YIM B11945 TaxID=3435410 RepID=UPI003D7CDF51